MMEEFHSSLFFTLQLANQIAIIIIIIHVDIIFKDAGEAWGTVGVTKCGTGLLTHYS